MYVLYVLVHVQGTYIHYRQTDIHIHIFPRYDMSILWTLYLNISMYIPILEFYNLQYKYLHMISVSYSYHTCIYRLLRYPCIICTLLVYIFILYNTHYYWSFGSPLPTYVLLIHEKYSIICSQIFVEKTCNLLAPLRVRRWRDTISKCNPTRFNK